VQCLSSAVKSIDNFTSFKISSEDESEQLIMKKQKLCREVHLNVSIVTLEVFNVVKIVNLNESFSLTTDSLTINNDLNMREVMKYDQEHIDLSFVINIERVGRTEQHMVESLKVVEEKLWTDLAIYCHVC